MADSISNYDDTIDSRDVIARIEELEEDRKVWNETPEENGGAWESMNPSDAEELADLLALQAEAEGYAADWRYGETLIRDSYFRDYAEQLAGVRGVINPDTRWPLNHIDWDAAADELRQDYTSVEFRGTTYWVR